jgi:hypothetical protein
MSKKKQLFCPIAKKNCNGQACVFWSKQYEECMILELLVKLIETEVMVCQK